MKNILLAILLTLPLAACNEPVQLIKTEYRVVDIPDQLYAGCPAIGKLPPYTTLSDVDVAKLIVRLYNNNAKCRTSILAIKKYLEDAKVLVEKGQEPTTVNGKSIY
jgi:hypothetical protein